MTAPHIVTDVCAECGEELRIVPSEFEVFSGMEINCPNCNQKNNVEFELIAHTSLVDTKGKKQ